MPPPRIFLNAGFSGVVTAVRQIKAACPSALIVASGKARSHILRYLADEWIPEPDEGVAREQGPSPNVPLPEGEERFVESSPSADASKRYIDWCLGVCERFGIDLFWPQKRAGTVALHRQRFADAGVATLLVSDAPTLLALARKSTTYARLASADVPLPPHVLVRRAEDWRTVSAAGFPGFPQLCVKPDLGVYGLGFRVIVPTPQRFVSRGVRGATVEEMAAKMAAEEAVGGGLAHPRMVMPFLEGHEHSIDILADRGRVVAQVARKKSLTADRQRVELPDEVANVGRIVTAHLGLSGLFNAQVRQGRPRPEGQPDAPPGWGGPHWLLEINPRMSGGLRMSCLGADYNFPWRAVQVALGVLPADVPPPRFGAVVTTMKEAVLLQAAPDDPARDGRDEFASATSHDGRGSP